MKKLCVVFVLAMFLTQCSEDEAKKTCKLVLQKNAGIEYYENGRVYAILQLDGANEPVANGERREFEFQDGKLMRIDERYGEVLNRYFEFEYLSNQIIQKEYFDEDPDADYTVTYTLDDDGLIVKKVNEGLNEPVYSFTEVYQHDGRNVSKITATSDEEGFNYIRDFEYDSKRNPDAITGFEIYFQDNIFSYRTQNPNNITKSTITYVGKDPQVTTYSYTYNSEGYATEKFANGGSDPIWFYDFECK